MRTVNVSIGDFLQANQRATVIQLIPYLLQGGQSGYKLLSTIAACQRLFLTVQTTFSILGALILFGTSLTKRERRTGTEQDVKTILWLNM